LLSALITGPIWTPASRPFPTFLDRAAAAMTSVNVPRASPTVIATDVARQRCPAHPNAESVTIAPVISMSASGRTITGFFAPPWHWARLPLAAARE
jgi:hypothetical protein